MPPFLSVSTWSLHRALGPTYWDSPDKPDRSPQHPYGEGNLSLIELPRKLAQMGIHHMEICHFHVPTLDDAYLRNVCAAMRGSGVTLNALLIDAGDISHPEDSQRDQDWIAGWLEIAAKLGAKYARVSGGKTTGEGAVERSREALRNLMPIAEANEVKLMTENWQDLLSTPEAVLQIMEGMEGRLGLCMDFGNWSGPDKYDALQAIAPYATSCHAKCSFDADLQPDLEDYQHCMQIAQAAGFDGSYTLIYDGPNDDEWAGLKQEMAMAKPYLS